MSQLNFFRLIWFVLVLTLLGHIAIWRAYAQAPCLYADDGTFLGCYSNEYDPNSINNPYGQYGSEYSPDSVNNPYGQYGSEYSPTSPNNPYATSPVIIPDQDIIE